VKTAFSVTYELGGGVSRKIPMFFNGHVSLD
jgi:hypothetical protein